MASWKQFTYEEKKKIEELIKQKKNANQIATELQRSYSSIQREIVTYGGYAGYSAEDSFYGRKKLVAFMNEAPKKKQKKLIPISFQERIKIEDLLKRNYSVRLLATVVGRPQSTINNEIKRNGGRAKYNCKDAQKRFETVYQERKENVSHTLIKKYREKMGIQIEEEQEQEEEQEEVKLDQKIDQQLAQRISNLEMQIEILFETIRGLKNGN